MMGRKPQVTICLYPNPWSYSPLLVMPLPDFNLCVRSVYMRARTHVRPRTHSESRTCVFVLTQHPFLPTEPSLQPSNYFQCLDCIFFFLPYNWYFQEGQIPHLMSACTSL